MLANFKNNVVPNVSRLDGNTIDDEERVSFGMVSGTSVDSHIRSVDWTDSIIENCRFNNTTLENSSFDRVAILDCNLSGVTFSNCLLRECLIMGVNAKYHFALDDCILDHVMFARSRVDRFDIHNTRIVDIEFLGVEASQLDFLIARLTRERGAYLLTVVNCEKLVGLRQWERMESTCMLMPRCGVIWAIVTLGSVDFSNSLNGRHLKVEYLMILPISGTSSS